MSEYEVNEIIKRQLCKEAAQIAENIQKTQTMSSQDLEKIDKIYHAKKSLLTAVAMEEAEGYGENMNGGNSGYRGRAMNGRYVSRESNGNNSYTEGYSDGYSEAMNRMNNGETSGHYPMTEHSPRRW